jgi:hypothetical protein
MEESCLKKHKIVSASMRTDIPGFYSPWFYERLKEGKVKVWDPYTGTSTLVSLRKDDVDRFLFWSRNYQPFFKCVEFLGKNNFHADFHYTITGLPTEFEPCVQSLETSLKTFKELALRTSIHQVHWRFDPIVFTEKTPPSFILEQFAKIAQALSGYTYKCFFDFGVYESETSASKLPSLPLKLHEEELKTFLLSLKWIANQANIRLISSRIEYASPSASDSSSFIIESASCLEGGEKHLPLPAAAAPIVSTYAEQNHGREVSCACSEMIDIGSYDTCLHGCVYCFATENRELALERKRKHLKSSLSLPDPARFLKDWTPKHDPAYQNAAGYLKERM